MAARKAPAKKAGTAATDRTSTTRGKTVQEATAEEAAQKKDAAPVPEAVAEVESQGYFGETPDDTPNEHYTVSGVLAGKPVPETDQK